MGSGSGRQWGDDPPSRHQGAPSSQAREDKSGPGGGKAGEFERTSSPGERYWPTCWGRLRSQPQHLVFPQELYESRGPKLSTGGEPLERVIGGVSLNQVWLDQPRSGIGAKAASRVGLGFAVT